MFRFVSALAALSIAAGSAAAQPTDTGEAGFRALYKELVETNTTPGSAGSCTLAVRRLAARLTAAGLPADNVKVLIPDGKPEDGNLVAIFPGKDPKAKAVLLLGHIDVVEAKREDWERDPFVLVEEDGYFYARGAFDDKAQSAIFADLLTRFQREGYKPRRTVKLALTCGEEGGRTNGARWLTQNHRELIDAGLAINEGGGGSLDAAGKRVSHGVLVAEKSPVSFTFEVTNPGGHSSRPVPDNAIYHLARALDRMSAYEFPVQFNDANRGYFTRMAKVVGGDIGAAMAAIVANPGDAAADRLLSRDPNYHAFLRTTCVATMLDAGHAGNALPQRARATVSCRVLPGVPAEEVRQTLIRVIDNPVVKVSEPRVGFPYAKAPPLTPAVLEPIEKITQAMWPGVPVIPIMEAGATDSTFLNAAGIPAYGVSGLFVDPDIGRIHGLNERIRVRSVMEGRDFLYRLIKAYAEQKD